MSDSNHLRSMKFWIDNIAKQVCLFPVEDYQAVLDELNRMDTILPFTDPTAWIKGHDNLRDNIKMVRAIVEARRKLDELAPDDIGSPDRLPRVSDDPEGAPNPVVHKQP